MTQPLAPKGAKPHPIFGHIYCGQTAAWIKMSLGTAVGLGLGDIVFDVQTQLPPEKRAHLPHLIFGPCILWPNGWMDEDTAWYGSRPRPRPHCTRRGPSSRERGIAVPLFSACVYCGHGRPSQLLLSSCKYLLVKNGLHNSIDYTCIVYTELECPFIPHLHNTTDCPSIHYIEGPDSPMPRGNI